MRVVNPVGPPANGRELSIRIAEDFEGVSDDNEKAGQGDVLTLQHADYLKSAADMVAYLEACVDEAGDDPAFIAVACRCVSL